MKKIFLFSVLIICSCSKVNPPQQPEVKMKFWMETVFLTEAKTTGYAGNELDFYIDVVTIEDEGIQWYVDTNSFIADTVSGVIFTPVTVEGIMDNKNENYSQVILIDEKTTWNTGPDLLHSINRGLKKSFIENQGKTTLGIYGEDNHLGVSPMYLSDENEDGNYFDNSYEYLVEELTRFSAYEGTASSSNLYNTLDATIDILVNNNPEGEKYITLITDNGNEVSGISFTTILNKCLANNIHLNLIACRVPDQSVVRLVTQTGGWLMSNEIFSMPGYSNNYRPETGLFFTDEMNRKNYKKYRVHCKATKSSSWFNGNLVSGAIGIYFKIPNEDIYLDVDFDFKLPFYMLIQ